MYQSYLFSLIWCISFAYFARPTSSHWSMMFPNLYCTPEFSIGVAALKLHMSFDEVVSAWQSMKLEEELSFWAQKVELCWKIEIQGLVWWHKKFNGFMIPAVWPFLHVVPEHYAVIVNCDNDFFRVVDLQAYLQRFQWDMAKFPIKQSLKAIADQISKQMSQIEGDLKNKATAYNSIKGNLQNLERKAT